MRGEAFLHRLQPRNVSLSSSLPNEISFRRASFWAPVLTGLSLIRQSSNLNFILWGHMMFIYPIRRYCPWAVYLKANGEATIASAEQSTFLVK
jgi:hypothetical protein